MLPSKIAEIEQFLLAKQNGIEINADSFKAAAASRPRADKRGSIAVIPVYGAVSQRMNMMQEFSGGTSTEMLAKDIQAAADTDSVKAIVLNIDSPGGSVYGVKELSDVIYQAREKKHITAVSNSLSASAAYWIGTSASEFVVTPGGEVGSIGVYTAHNDFSENLAKEGIKTTLISAGKHKVDGNPYEPLTEDSLNNIQSRVNEYYDDFVNAIARNRGVSADAVKNGYGQGRVVGAEEAIRENMADRIATFDEVLEKLGAKQANTLKARVKMI